MFAVVGGSPADCVVAGMTHVCKDLKPELVLEALFSHMGLTYDPNAIQIHRKDVYASDGDDFVSLGAMGEVIE